MGTIYVMAQLRFTLDTTCDNLLNDIFKSERGIKIGYSKNLRNRLSQYNTDSYGYILLFTIENATMNGEKKLHQYFQNYLSKDSNSREWFVWNNDIYNFFKDHKTIKEIREIIPEIKISNKEIEKYKRIITPILNIMVENEIGFDRSEFNGLSNSEIVINLLDKYVTETQYFASCEEFIDFLRDELSEEEINIILDELDKILSAIKKELEEFNQTPYYHDKMRYVCQLGKTLDKDKFSTFLNSIPISFKNYYTVLGPGRCSTAWYQKGEMEKIYQKLLGNQGIDIGLILLDNFKVGDRYSNTEVNNKLRAIYEKVGYKKFPMTTDLNVVFETKPCKVNNPDTKKRDNGIEIISKK